MTETTEKKAPVRVSAGAYKDLATKMREWSGWRDTTLTLGAPDPKVSPWAMTDLDKRAVTINVDELTLNPNRVINSVTPFRLRQEAVLTGAMLHEAAHIRFSKWMPKNEDELKALRHSDGSEVKVPTLMLARLAEEARIEGLMARHIDRGGMNLGWTMRASSAHLLPVTVLDVTNADQQIMALLQSWVLRAGRQVALAHATGFKVRLWVRVFTDTLDDALVAHLFNKGDYLVEPSHTASTVIGTLQAMIKWDGTDPVRWVAEVNDDDLGFVDEDEVEISKATAFPPHAHPFMLDKAREILRLLFPETEGDEGGAPMVGGCCGTSGGQPENGEDEGASGGDSDEQGSGEGEGRSEADGPGDGESEGEGAGSAPSWADDLSDLEAQADGDGKSESKEESAKEAQQLASGGITGGLGGGTDRTAKGTRNPSKTDRETAKEAERFLRDLINPSESSSVVLTEAPSATVDPAALASWRAGGMTREPRFFRRIKRTMDLSPPVKIAILVDVSGSMDQLQKPSALLSWALASAALDLRNFAGRGQQIESTLIHWGDSARVIQKNGAPIKGITEHECYEGTSAMHMAFELVDSEIPGFFDPSPDGKPENRLLVQFTDWQLNYSGRTQAKDGVIKALANGVNMLSVMPSGGFGFLPQIIKEARIQRGRSQVMLYDPKRPNAVWDEASRLLANR